MPSAEAPPSLKALALFLLLAGLAAWPVAEQPSGTAVQSWPGQAVWRRDGGQNLSAAGSREPCSLSRMALGRKVDLGQAGPRELMALPGLGPGRAARIIRLRAQAQLYWEPRDLGLNEPAWRELSPYAKLPDPG